jgi:hypothetical protein
LHSSKCGIVIVQKVCEDPSEVVDASLRSDHRVLLQVQGSNRIAGSRYFFVLHDGGSK